MFMVKSKEKNDRAPYYNGCVSVAARFTSYKRALRFDQETAEKIVARLATIDNWDWEVVEDGTAP